MSKKLKPCPFCGSKAVLTHIPPDGTPYRIGDDGLYIVCCYDDECGDGKSGSNLDNVIKEWNTRPLEDAANARAEKAEARAERYEDALQQIHNWAIAYPLDVFPEPDFKRVREVLEAAGITLDSVSASNMRHVIQGVERIVDTALKRGES